MHLTHVFPCYISLLLENIGKPLRFTDDFRRHRILTLGINSLISTFSNFHTICIFTANFHAVFVFLDYYTECGHWSHKPYFASLKSFFIHTWIWSRCWRKENSYFQKHERITYRNWPIIVQCWLIIVWLTKINI